MSVQASSPSVWSKSQVASLKECSRKALFHIKSVEEQGDSLTQKISQLKKMKNRYLWTGSMIHEEIGQLLKIVRQGSPVPPLDAWVSSVRDKMRDQFKLSRAGDASHRLFEHEYNIVIPGVAWAKHWDTVEQCLRWFYQSKWLGRLTSLGPECWKAVDEILSFDVNGIKSFVKIDCGVEMDGRIFLMDWTTSAPKDSAQDNLAVAALYAHEVWGAEAENIQASAVSLLDGKTFHAHIDEDVLMQVFLKIEEESGLLDQARVEFSKVDDWKTLPAAEPATCRWCSYQKICYPENGGLHGAV